MAARLRSTFLVTPFDSSQIRIARLTCSGTGTPSRSHTSRSPSSRSSSIRNVVIRRDVILVSHRNTKNYELSRGYPSVPKILSDPVWTFAPGLRPWA